MSPILPVIWPKIETKFKPKYHVNTQNINPIVDQNTHISYNTIKIRIRITMDNEPKHLSSFFICNDLHKVLYIVYSTSWHSNP